MASIDLNLSVAQKQILSQQMLQSVQILQMSAAELESYIENLALENPVIELGERETHPDRAEQMELQRKLDWLSSTDHQNQVYYQSERDSDDPENNWQDLRASEETLEDYLRAQLLRTHFSPREQKLLDCILNSLDSRGWFTDSLSEMCALY
ncbi:MAG: RNA polymerase sigma-54 factor, partial [Lachnospiraceae bacterium]|nr:RNA polymerase sigma-54 factor [Lachnospiraceae bacterium]